MCLGIKWEALVVRNIFQDSAALLLGELREPEGTVDIE